MGQMGGSEVERRKRGVLHAKVFDSRGYSKLDYY